MQSARTRARGAGVKGSDLKSDPSKLIEEPEGSTFPPSLRQSAHVKVLKLLTP